MTEDIQARDTFLRLFLDQSPGPQFNIPPEYMWYANFLECRFKISWTNLIQPSLVGIHSTVTAPFPRELAIAYRLLFIVAQKLMDESAIALTDILDELHKAKLLQIQSDGTRDVPAQLVFAAVGWLSK